jgi:CubicO group peptidase (beta-lactamase class C family)
LFGNAESILDFAYDMLTGTNISKAHIKKIQEKSYKNRSIGWEVANDGWSGGNLCSNQTIGHTGFTGTGIWIDFKNEIAWTLLTNRVHPSRHKSSEINSLRVKISENIIRLFGKV